MISKKEKDNAASFLQVQGQPSKARTKSLVTETVWTLTPPKNRCFDHKLFFSYFVEKMSKKWGGWIGRFLKIPSAFNFVGKDALPNSLIWAWFREMENQMVRVRIWVHDSQAYKSHHRGKAKRREWREVPKGNVPITSKWKLCLLLHRKVKNRHSI